MHGRGAAIVDSQQPADVSVPAHALIATFHKSLSPQSMHGLLNQAVVVLDGVGGGGGFSSLNTPELRAAIMWRRCDHDRREYRPHRHQGVGRGINPLRGQTFCPREDNTSLIVNRQSSIVNRQSSIVDRQPSAVYRQW